jgi:ABC-type antimicrobial peptide transport system permease subunit
MAKVGTFSKLAIIQIFRNKRKTFGVIIGVVLALILIVGSEIAINHSANNVLKSKMDVIPVDFYGFYYGDFYEMTSIPNFINLINSIKKVENIESAALIGSSWVFYNKSYPDDNSLQIDYNYSIGLNVISEDSPYIRKMFGVESFGFSPGKFTISNVMAQNMNITIGDKIILLREIYDNNNNFTISHVNLTCGNIITSDTNKFEQIEHYFDNFEDIDYYYFDYMFSSDFSIFIDFETYSQILQQIQKEHIWGWEIYPELYIWMDRDEIIDYGNIDKTKSKIIKLQRELEFVIGSEYELYSSQILNLLEEHNWWVLSNMIIYFAFSIPMMALGIYLGAISIDLDLGERKREIGLLKSHGASNRQILGYLLIEALILGIIAGILGVIFGIISSKIFLIIFFTQGNYSFMEVFTEFYMSIEMLIIGIGLGILFVLLASYRSIKKISKLSIIDSFAHYSTKTEEEEHKPGRDLILLWLGIFTFILMIYFDPSKLDFEMGIFESILLFILISTAYVLMPLFPFFIIFSITRLITRKATKVYDYISRVTKYLTKDLWYLINKNITRNPRRSIGITSIIALSLAFGIFISTTIDTNDVFNRRIVEAEVGSDIMFETIIMGQPLIYDPLLDEYIIDESLDNYQQEFYNLSNNLTQIEGIDKTTEISGYFDFPFPVSKTENYPNLYLINISTYYNTVRPDDYFFLGENPRNVLSKLKGENSILIDDYYAKEEDYSVGDHIPIKIHNQYLKLKIVGIVRVLPGVPMEIEIGYRESYNFYADINSKIGKLLNDSYHYHKFLIKVKPNYNHFKVADNIFENFSIFIDNLKVKQEELDSIMNDPEYYSINAFLKTEYIFTIMIITIGLGLLMYVAGIERKQEMGSIISRGASRKHIKFLYFGEGITTLILGLILGIITGFLVSIGFNSLLFAQTSQIEREFIISINTIIIIIIPIIILLIVTYFVSIIISKIELHKILRLRGG